MRSRNRFAICTCAILLLSLVSCRRTASPSAIASTPTVTLPLTGATLATPTVVPQRTATPITALKKFEGGGVGLWLPDTWVGGDLSKDLDVIIKKMRDLGPSYEQAAQTLEQNRSAFLFWAFDSKVGDSGFLTNVSVVTEQIPSAMSIDTYLDAAIKQFPSDFRAVERGLVTIGGYETGRIVLEASLGGRQIKEVMYVIKGESTIWVVTYATSAEEFDKRLPVFEQSIRTFAARP